MAVFWVSAWILTNPGDLQCPRERKKSGELSLLSVLQLIRYSHGIPWLYMLLYVLYHLIERVYAILYMHTSPPSKCWDFFGVGHVLGSQVCAPPTLHRLKPIVKCEIHWSCASMKLRGELSRDRNNWVVTDSFGMFVTTLQLLPIENDPESNNLVDLVPIPPACFFLFLFFFFSFPFPWMFLFSFLPLKHNLVIY